MVLIGPNLPHFWKEDQHNKNKSAEAYVIHFSEDFLGKDFFYIPKGKKLKHLLEQSRFGLKFHNEPDSLYIQKIKQIFSAKRI